MFGSKDGSGGWDSKGRVIMFGSRGREEGK